MTPPLPALKILPALATLLLLPSVKAAQDAPAGPSAPEEPPSRATAVEAEELRTRIQGMRMNLLLGGDAVRQAEQEAARFYEDRRRLVEGRLDDVEIELAEKRTSYDVALARALESGTPDARRDAMRSASTLRGEVSELEFEARDLTGKTTDLRQLVGAVQARDRERERLTMQLETSTDYGRDLGIPLFNVGLAPASAEPEPASPLDDAALIEDLLARDPDGARDLLWELDPAGYWERFPLRPPTAVLTEALAFPLPDLPYRR